MSVPYYAQGPLSNNDLVYIVADGGSGILEFLTILHTGQFLFVADHKRALPVIFNYQVTSDSAPANVPFTLSYVEGYLNITSTGSIGVSSSPQYMSATSSRTDEIMVGVEYVITANGVTMNVPSFGAMKTSPCVLPTVLQSAGMPLSKIRFVPYTLYVMGPDNAVETIAADAILHNEIDWWHMSHGCNTGQLVVLKGYTRVTDAKHNAQLTPCPVGTKCGDARGCYGTCDDPNKVCVWDRDGYTMCKINTTHPIDSGLTDRWWYILMIIVLVVLVGILVFESYRSAGNPLPSSWYY